MQLLDAVTVALGQRLEAPGKPESDKLQDLNETLEIIKEELTGGRAIEALKEINARPFCATLRNAYTATIPQYSAAFEQDYSIIPGESAKTVFDVAAPVVYFGKFTNLNNIYLLALLTYHGRAIMKGMLGLTNEERADDSLYGNCLTFFDQIRLYEPSMAQKRDIYTATLRYTVSLIKEGNARTNQNEPLPRPQPPVEVVQESTEALEERKRRVENLQEVVRTREANLARLQQTQVAAAAAVKIEPVPEDSFEDAPESQRDNDDLSMSDSQDNVASPAEAVAVDAVAAATQEVDVAQRELIAATLDPPRPISAEGLVVPVDGFVRREYMFERQKTFKRILEAQDPRYVFPEPKNVASSIRDAQGNILTSPAVIPVYEPIELIKGKGKDKKLSDEDKATNKAQKELNEANMEKVRMAWFVNPVLITKAGTTKQLYDPRNPNKFKVGEIVPGKWVRDSNGTSLDTLDGLDTVIKYEVIYSGDKTDTGRNKVLKRGTNLNKPMPGEDGGSVPQIIVHIPIRSTKTDMQKMQTTVQEQLSNRPVQTPEPFTQ